MTNGPRGDAAIWYARLMSEGWSLVYPHPETHEAWQSTDVHAETPFAVAALEELDEAVAEDDRYGMGSSFGVGASDDEDYGFLDDATGARFDLLRLTDSGPTETTALTLRMPCVIPEALGERAFDALNVLAAELGLEVEIEELEEEWREINRSTVAAALRSGFLPEIAAPDVFRRVTEWNRRAHRRREVIAAHFSDADVHVFPLRFARDGDGEEIAIVGFLWEDRHPFLPRCDYVKLLGPDGKTRRTVPFEDVARELLFDEPADPFAFAEPEDDDDDDDDDEVDEDED